MYFRSMEKPFEGKDLGVDDLSNLKGRLTEEEYRRLQQAIVRRVTEEGFDLLKKPPKVLGGLNTPMPYSAPLEDACLPQPDDIVSEIRELVG